MKKQTKHKTLVGNKFQFDTESFVSQINGINNIGSDTLSGLSDSARSDALRNHSRNGGLFKDNFSSIIKKTLSKPKAENYLTENVCSLDDDLPTVNMGKIGLAISPQKPDVLYAAIELERTTGGVYKSEDRGESWKKMSNAVSGATGPHYYQELYASPHKFDR